MAPPPISVFPLHGLHYGRPLPKYRKSPYIPVRVYMSLFFAFLVCPNILISPVLGCRYGHIPSRIYRHVIVCTKSVGRVFNLSEAEAGGGGRCFPELYNTLPNITRYLKIGGIRPYVHGGYNTLTSSIGGCGGHSRIMQA